MKWVLVVKLMFGGTMALPYGANVQECRQIATELAADKENIEWSECRQQRNNSKGGQRHAPM